MTSRRSRETALRAFLICYAAVVFAAVLYGGLTSGTVFGVYNDNWEGTSELRSLAASSAEETQTIESTSGYTRTNPDSTVSFVLSPDSAYTDRDAARVERFVRNGGTLVVAEDYGNASNRLLSRLGADARLDGAPVRDERNYVNSPAMPRVRTASDHEYTAGVSRLAMNHGTVVVPNGSSVLVNTSSFAYVDRNRNERLDAGENLGARPVVTRERLGDGDVVVVADPSLFINIMLDHADNRRLARNLVAGHRDIVFDASHLGALPPLVAARAFLRDSVLVQATVGVALVVATAYLGTVVRGRVRAQRPPPRPEETSDSLDPKALETWIRDRHPGWDEARVRRVAQEICRQKRNKWQDE